MQEFTRINLDITINSGQVFLWDKIDGVWYGVNGTEILRVKQNPFDIISSQKKPSDFFRQEDNMEKILNKISRDNIVRTAVERFPGLRLLRQDPFQCYISFICSSNSSIQNIKQMLKRICQKFGKKMDFDGYEFFAFPAVEKLAKANLKDLLSCGLGFRAKYVKTAAMSVHSDALEFDFLKKTDYKSAKDDLKNIYGIGNKVADCILLFSLEKLEAFPIDRWTQRILQKYYSKKFFGLIEKSLTEKNYEDIHEKIVEYFGPYAGYSQQFLFKMERDLNKKKWL
ncbi:MAG: DNA repair protein [Thaumarchaeota archaeon]|nr:MAG: DNA repair protein [Nitrososphaerota archaeon]